MGGLAQCLFMYIQSCASNYWLAEQAFSIVFLGLDLKHQIEKIKNSVAVFKRLLADMKPGPACE